MISLNLLRAELLKLKGIRLILSYIVLIVGSISIVFFYFLNQDYEEFILRNSLEENPNPWYSYYASYLFLLVFVLPIIASISTFLIKSIEDKADAWKRIYILPYRKDAIHLNKLLIIWLYISIYMIGTFLILILSATLLSKLKPDFHFSSHSNYNQILLVLFFKFELSILAITAFCYAYMLLIGRVLISLLLSIFLPLFCLFFENQYSSALYQFFLLHRSRLSLIINHEHPDMLQFNEVSQHDIICIIILLISIGLLILASKKLIINYE
jgi:hypothetical protein